MPLKKYRVNSYYTGEFWYCVQFHEFFFSLQELVLFFKGTFYTYLVVIHEHKTIQELYVIKCMHNFEVRMLGHIPRFGSLCHKWGSAWVPSSWKFHRNHWLSSRKLKKIMIENYLSFQFFPFISRCRLSIWFINT